MYEQFINEIDDQLYNQLYYRLKDQVWDQLYLKLDDEFSHSLLICSNINDYLYGQLQNELE